jgi:hypothetical protein
MHAGDVDQHCPPAAENKVGFTRGVRSEILPFFLPQSDQHFFIHMGKH